MLIAIGAWYRSAGGGASTGNSADARARATVAGMMEMQALGKTEDAIRRSKQAHAAANSAAAQAPLNTANAAQAKVGESNGAAAAKVSADGYREMDWLEMMPADEIEALKHGPAISHVGMIRMQQIGTYRTIAALDGQKVQLAGYVVPIDADDQGNLTEFFLVPYFGACIHVPPPPPNQLIYAKLAKGITPPEIWDPYWLKGVLRSRKYSSDLAGAAYSMDQATLERWDKR